MLGLLLLRLDVKSRYYLDTTTKKITTLLLLVYWLCFIASLQLCLFWIIHLPPA
jgi:hypothetical protein